MNKIIKRPESIPMHQLTENGVEKFMEVIGLLRQHIDEQKKLYNIKPGNIDSRILQLLRELPKINSGESKKIKNSPLLNLTYVHPTRFELSRYIFQGGKDGPLAWVGRVAPEKGLEDAAYVASEIGEKLNVWGFIEDKDYASRIIESYPSGHICWKGYLQTNELQEQLGKCRALINTPKWNEAYGNVVVEAMACGVPVVAYKRGGPGEIIQHGKTGFLVKADDKESLLFYLKKISNINRSKCREWVENNASSDIFAQKVVSWLKRVIKEYK